MVKGLIRNALKLVPDALYLKLKYRAYMGKRLDLKDPKTFCEKLQWLKLHDRNPAYTAMVDKASAKDYAAEKIGSEQADPGQGESQGKDRKLPENQLLLSWPGVAL